MVIVLTVVSLVAALVLALVNEVTTEPIRQQAINEINNGIKDVMSTPSLKVTNTDTISVSNDGTVSKYVIHNTETANGKPLGAAIESSVMGFGGELKILVGISNDYKVLGYKILQSSETPGLGQKADKWFQKDGKGNIIGKSLANGDLKVSKDGGDVDAITASTITSRAFLKAVNQAYSAYQDNHAASAKGADGASGASVQHN